MQKAECATMAPSRYHLNMILSILKLLIGVMYFSELLLFLLVAGSAYPSQYYSLAFQELLKVPLT